MLWNIKLVKLFYSMQSLNNKDNYIILYLNDAKLYSCFWSELLIVKAHLQILSQVFSL